MNTKQLRYKIIGLAMRGQLVPQNSTDETASALLARINVERSAAGRIGNVITHIKDAPFTVPESWIWCRLGDICLNFQYGTSQKSDKEGKVAVLRMGNLQNGKLDYTDLAYTSDDSDINKYALKPNELLFNRTNSPEWVGKTAIYRGEIQAIFAGYLIRVSPILINPDYLNYLMNSEYHRDICAQAKTDGVNQSNINAQKLSNFIYPIPPIAEQQRIVEKVHSAFSVIDEIEKSRSDLQTIVASAKSKILALAFHGQLALQDPVDEPASSLIAGDGTDEQALFEVPDGWVWTRLGQACEVYTGNSINETEKKEKYTGIDNGRYYIATKDIGFDNQVNYENGVRIPTDAVGFKVAPKGAVLLCIEGGSAGRKIAIINQEVCFVNKLCCFNPLAIDNMYLYYYLQSPDFIQLFKSSVNGIIGGVGVNVLKKLVLPIPPLPEQRRIVTAIESAFEQLNIIATNLN